MLYEQLFKRILFLLNAETAHNLAAWSLAGPIMRPPWALHHRFYHRKLPRLNTSLCGLPLENPVGLAAGFDKNAHMYQALHYLGFGFMEIGTVTAKAQSGNPKPRLFRLPKDEALLNRMGFNNDGVEVAAQRLARRKAKIPLGGNIGKSKVTPLNEAVSDYAYSFKLLRDHVDYFVVNVSSPNTPNLRELQEKDPLLELLSHLSELNADHKLPILLKIAPDLTSGQLEDIVDVVSQTGLNGVIATNTTISREGLQTDSAQVEGMGAGGISGRPVRARSTEMIRDLRRLLPDQVDIVGVGGIFSGADAYEKIRAGARCVQIYTGLIYRGPAGVFQICRELSKLLERDGFQNVNDAVGVDLEK